MTLTHGQVCYLELPTADLAGGGTRGGKAPSSFVVTV